MTTLTESKRGLMEKWRSDGIPANLIRAFERVPREEFIPEPLRAQAYVDQPLLIGHEQTISQPTTVMNMLMLLELKPKMKILEIGSGSGYVAALLSVLGCSVTGLEIVPELAIRSARAIEKSGLKDVKIHAADGGGGWEENAPYDRIVISAACPEVPRHLFWQLKKGGVLVAPVGLIEQRMIVCRKKGEKDIVEEDHGAYVFVPLTGRFGDGNPEDSIYE